MRTWLVLDRAVSKELVERRVEANLQLRWVFLLTIVHTIFLGSVGTVLCAHSLTSAVAVSGIGVNPWGGLTPDRGDKYPPSV